ncbi:response regulator [Brachyspira hampsonii]|uniref:Putative winged helix family wo component transcriptional regulator n=1 Tax=Brachyspira hampsonii 30446 TaxID=1289135 RepID=A0A2U4F2V6_9SPIR|nr:response regulator [Brachyspira hampsonii]EKV57719.1 putative winged helix family wo component transcriptional regulator [Brachyspira hampsonii 30446]MBW5390783.1 response regulator [Brachyspira hampsonii]MBW5394199.1 response regulator [Brachyspira hampsonii]OEJ16998.1 transcriptional regulator [Brachyspira hampsonii]PTY41167.1 transcriptional regulator [Brachyspira hampsonii bv. II]
MRVLIYDSSLQIRDSLISILITAGYEVVAVKDKNNILSMFGKLPFSIAIIEIGENDTEMESILEKIYLDDRYHGVHVIVHVADPSREFFTKMMRIGVSGFLLKPFNEKDFLNRFNVLIEKAGVKPKKLKHIVINNLDNFKLVFRHDGVRQILHGMIIEMSPVGLKFIMPPEEASIEVGHIIKNASMSISSYKISFSINILEKIGNEYIGEFSDLSAFNAKLICKFIYDKYIEKLK